MAFNFEKRPAAARNMNGRRFNFQLASEPASHPANKSKLPLPTFPVPRFPKAFRNVVNEFSQQKRHRAEREADTKYTRAPFID